jgi:hypothetical protein
MVADMESHIAGRYASKLSLPFVALRAISDTVHDDIPPAAINAINPDGTINIVKTIGSVLFNPLQVPNLIRLNNNTKAALKVLADYIDYTNADLNFPQ